MKLSQIIEQFRKDHDLSQRQFAARCGLSNGYIAMIEREANPATGRPIIPTLPALEKIAAGLRISLDDLLGMMDDVPVSLRDDSTPADLAPDEARLLSVYRSLSREGREKVQDFATMAAALYTSEKNNGVPDSGAL